MINSSLFYFAKTLAGKYSNTDQAKKKPRDFAHINIYFRPLEWSILNGPWFYSEQSYVFSPWSPYRQGIHKLLKKNKIYIVENYEIIEPERIAGSGFRPELLKAIRKDMFYKRCGCSMQFKEIKPGSYIGKVEPGRNCKIQRGEKLTYLVSNVEFNQAKWISLDEGFDEATNEKIWGSEHGPLKFRKVESLANNLIGEWLKI